VLTTYRKRRALRRQRKQAASAHPCQGRTVRGGKCKAIAGASGYCAFHLVQMQAEDRQNTTTLPPAPGSPASSLYGESSARASKNIPQRKAPKPVESQSELRELQEQERLEAWTYSVPAPHPDGTGAMGSPVVVPEPPELPPEWPSERPPSPRQILSRHYGQPERLNPEEAVVEFTNLHNNWDISP
jgi:hypothetical protein